MKAHPDDDRSAPARRRVRWLLRLAAALTAPALLLAGAPGRGVRAVHADQTFDQALFSLINQDRAQNGLAPLRWNSSIAAVAETSNTGCAPAAGGRAQDMIVRNYFSHSIPGCSNIFGIYQAAGINYSWAGENIGWESGVTDPVQAAQYLNTQYMNSPEHRANILNPNYTDVGVGSAPTAPGQSWTGAGGPLQNVLMSVEDFVGNPGGAAAAPPAPQATSPSLPATTSGYWLTGADGATFDFAATGNYGGVTFPLNRPIVGMAATGDRGGYWLVASDGGIFPFGDAGGYGSTGGIRLNQPIVGMAATPSGLGYWLVAADGGIFPFGDAGGYGSTGNIRLNQPIVGMAATPSGHGYWLVARDGGIFPFGDAVGYGSTGNIRLNQPIVAMAATHAGAGYWLVAADGGIFPFGDAAAHSYGSTGGIRLAQSIVDMAPTRDGNGYWLVAADGGIFPFGDAAGWGSTGGKHLNAPIVAMTAG